MIHAKIDSLLEYFEIANPDDGANTTVREVALGLDRVDAAQRRRRTTAGTMEGVVSEQALARMVRRNQRDLQQGAPQEHVRHTDSCAVS